MAVFDKQVKNFVTRGPSSSSSISDCLKESWLDDHNYYNVPEFGTDHNYHVKRKDGDECYLRTLSCTMEPRYLNSHGYISGYRKERALEEITSMENITITDGIQNRMVKKSVDEKEENGKKFKRLKTFKKRETWILKDSTNKKMTKIRGQEQYV